MSKLSRTLRQAFRLAFTNPASFLYHSRIKMSGHERYFYDLLKKGTITFDSAHGSYVRDVCGHSMHLNPKDTGLSRVLARDGIREKESVDTLLEYLRPDMTILEIGANIGFYVLLEARVISHGKGRIFAIEPGPGNIDFLKLNIEANGYRKYVDLHQGAIYDHTGPLKLELFPASNLHRLAAVSLASDCIGTVDVPGYTIKDFLEKVDLRPDKLDFLRMDIEGAEYDVLSDNMDLLSAMKSFFMFIEFHPHINREKHIEVLKKLEEIGFSCLSATKEFVENEVIMREHRPATSIRQLYTDEFYMRLGGCETFLRK